MDQTKMSKDEISRRSLLKGMPVVAGAVVSFGAVGLSEIAAAQTKLTHEVAKYQDKPNNGQQCSTCLQFEPPASCKLVASPISPNGWCQFYAKKT